MILSPIFQNRLKMLFFQKNLYSWENLSINYTLMRYNSSKQGRIYCYQSCVRVGRAIFEVTRPFWHEQWGQRKKIIKKSQVWLTNRPTNRPTDKAGCRVACTQLKRNDMKGPRFYPAFKSECYQQNLCCALSIHFWKFRLDLPKRTWPTISSCEIS